MTTDIYPWHQSQWQDIERRLAGGRLPHALLMSGPEGLGKNDFATRLASRLLCSSPTGMARPCGSCKHCRLFQAGTHPDFRQVTVEPEKTRITIDQIRELSYYLSLTSQSSSYKLAVIYPAEAMNQNAANSLLKTLEEPAANSLLMLVSHQPGRLPATIRSRCQVVSFARPQADEARLWLQDRLEHSIDAGLMLDLAGGLPLRALELGRQGDEVINKRNSIINDILGISNGEIDPVKSADRWLKLGPKTSLYYLYSWITDMARLSLSAAPPYLANPDLRGSLSKLAEKLGSAELFRHLDCTRQAIAGLDASLNVQLLLEDVLIPWRYGFK